MIADGNRDIETYGFSDILFAHKTAAGNKTMRSIIKLPKRPEGRLGKSRADVLIC